MIIVAGTARVHADRLDDAVEAASAMAAASRAEAGCRAYRFALDIDDRSIVHLFEQWDDQSALDAHFGTEHFGRFSTSLGDVLDGAPSFTRYVIEDAGPLFG